MSTETQQTAEEVKEATITLTGSDLLQLVAKMGQDSREGIIAAIQEMKKPSESEQAKIDTEKRLQMQQALGRVENAKREDARREQRIVGCSHRRKDGKTALRGQVLSNGYSQAFCQNNCGYLSKPFKLAPHEISGGVNMGEWVGDAFGVVEARVRNSPLPPPIPDVPFGGTFTFGEV